MPRTKAPKKNVEKEQPAVKEYVQKMEEEFALRRNNLNEIRSNVITALDILLREERLVISSRLGNKTIAELKAGVSETTTFVGQTTLMSSMSTTKSSAHKSGSSSRQLRRSVSLTEDDGYLTAGSNASSEARTTRPSRLQQQRRTQRVSRSLSRSKAYKTPANKLARPLNFGTITPKMKPNAPQLVLRRPKLGEVAVSMQGSPLLVSGVVSDDVPNVNIPLGDGRTISIQPQRGLRPSLLPALDLQTKKQIEALRDNLNRVCASAALTRL